MDPLTMLGLVAIGIFIGGVFGISAYDYFLNH
ncbi:membrane protein [Gordonia phage Neville]|uniref:Uncharacterized protein n=2 Tax=Nevillevirus TaxID=3044773 RepID=A0A515MH27_9CAUD|nr:membrane protein [Gordonia phage Neville]YP_010246080.1 hypothetical protein L3Y20_gp095 [Gordonia phage Trax]AXQ64457.1 membrane protein [Gordonia phage Neville]QDM55982.1 hypothetical protein SEA_TRAX_95 [Gordonia phage Trax]